MQVLTTASLPSPHRYVGSKIAGLRSHIARQTDQRVKLMHDVLAGSESLKVNAWEDALARRVQKLRATEERLIWRGLALLSTLEALIFFAPGLATFLVLVTRYAIDDARESAALSIERAYAVLGLCNVLVKQFNVFPRAVKSFDEASVSFRRCERFLLLPEATGCATPPLLSHAFWKLQQALQGEMIRLDAVTATWTLERPSTTVATSRAGVEVTRSPKKPADPAKPGPVAASAEGSEESRQTELPISQTELPTSQTELPTSQTELPRVEVLVGTSAATANGTSSDAATANGTSSDAANTNGSASASTSAADGEEPFALTNLSMSVKAGQLCLLIGEVGSGKSSVLQLLLGEMLVCSGGLRVSTEGGIGYVPQHAWIVNASVRDNILLGRAFDEAWYSEVLGCVCLGVDLASFPTGDRTEIGERGVTVSGGQKARISLARALYGKPALLLLDDPLSAVDMHMAHHLVDVALLRVARRTLGCTVVLASHQLQFVHELADQVVLLAHGRVLAQGTPADLAAQGLLLAAGHPTPALSPADTKPASVELEAAPGATPAAVEPDAKATATEPLSMLAPPKAAAGVLPSAPSEAAAMPAGSSTAMAGKPAAGSPNSGSAGASAAEMGRANQPGEARRFYLRHLGGLGCLAITLTFLCLAVCRALADWSLGRWITFGQRIEGAALYAGLTGTTVGLGVAYALSFTRVISAASRIHAEVLARVLRAPKSFFDTSPLGLLLNVFSKDMDTLDELLPIALAGFLKCLTIVSSAVIVSAIAAPAALTIAPVVFYVFRELTNYLQLTANQLKRIEKASSGPLFSLYTETLQGVTSIRAFGLQREFEARLVQRLDLNHRAHFLWTASNRWFAARLDVLTCCITLSVALCVIIFREALGEPSIAALSLTYVVQTTSLFQWGFRMWAEVQNNFVSVERALSYTKLPQEAAATEPTDAALIQRGWPEAAAVRFAEVRMRYRPGLPLALDGADFAFTGGIKAAVVGRSGAGETSL